MRGAFAIVVDLVDAGRMGARPLRGVSTTAEALRARRVVNAAGAWVGDDPALPGFFWLAGQGGCGIETSPALRQIAADLIAGGKTSLFDVDALSPTRFAASSSLR